MRLKRLVAEYLYLKEHSDIDLFDQASSNTQDYYCRTACQEIPALLHGYISNRGWLGKLVRGCIRDFINVHGVELNKDNFNSLAKRIISRIKGQSDEPAHLSHNEELLVWLTEHNERKYVLKLNGLDWEKLKTKLLARRVKENSECESH